MIKSDRLCRIMIKDIKTRISKLNIDFDFEAYWEIIYLILLAFFVGMRFLLSTMFTIYWPKYFYRTLTVIGVVLVLLHLMMAKDISKKEIAAMLVVTFVFMMSHYVSRYDFLVDLLILILGAYRVNFRNILKTYIAVWSVLLVVTIIGAMTGLAENLVFYQDYVEGVGFARERMALGICYPTDLAAYVAFLMLTYVYIREEDITYLEIGIMFALTCATYYITDARTDFVVMLMLIFLTLVTKIKYTSISKFIKKTAIRKGILTLPIVLAASSWILTGIYDDDSEIWLKIDAVLSGRLAMGKVALHNYNITAFGQYVIEKGFGGSTDWPDNYFFIDCSYISMGIKFGIIFLILIFVIYTIILKRCLDTRKLFWCIVLVVVAIQSATEHHFIQYWYNPFLIVLFTNKQSNVKRKMKNHKDEVINLN